MLCIVRVAFCGLRPVPVNLRQRIKKKNKEPRGCNTSKDSYEMTLDIIFIKFVNEYEHEMRSWQTVLLIHLYSDRMAPRSRSESWKELYIFDRIMVRIEKRRRTVFMNIYDILLMIKCEGYSTVVRS